MTQVFSSEQALAVAMLDIKRAALAAGEKVNQSEDRVLGVQMLRRYGTLFAGIHSAIYSCTIPSLIISTMPMDSKSTEKHTKKLLGFRAFSSSWFQSVL